MLKISHTAKLALICACLFGVHYSAIADDIDIFNGSSGGTSAAPNVMFLLDNTSNWSTNATNTCASSSSACPALPTSPAGQAYNTSAKVGGNELNAIIVQLASMYTSTNGAANVNVGIASYTASGSNQYGYVRFGARNVANTTAYGALVSMLSNLDPNASATKVNVGKKEETESLFELYQYFNSGAPGGAVSISGLADYPGNTPSGGLPQLTSSGANYTAYNLASCGVTNTGCLYNGPTTSCSKNFIIYIVNHDHSNNGLAGSAQYYGVPSTPLTAITPWTISGVTGETRWIEEWTNFLFQNGITTYIVDIGGDASPTNQYSIDLMQAAKLGGGKYFALSSATAMSGTGSLTAALAAIFSEIQAVNTSFASVSLPVSATNRAQDKNQVFIPMFRPDPNANPLWRGNLKEYQLINSGGSIDLGDATGSQAINSVTGFATACAQSFWTTDSSTYWQGVTLNPSAKGTCATSTQWNDLPDGPLVEKGGVAEVLRKGNNPSGSTTWALNRTVYTQPLAGGALAAFTSSSPGLNTATGLSTSTTPTLANMTNFILGQDVNAELSVLPPPGLSSTPATLTRPSIHGDTIHSQPLPVDYGSSTGVYVYYGANDGMLRAVNTANGKEVWAFVAPEFYSRLTRLVTQSPLVSFPGQSSGISPTPTAKDYFFDGSIGLYQNAANTSIWIYPTMRRGGRTLYAFDVSSPTSPVYKWKVGCPNLTNNTGCAATSSASWTGTTITSMGQTWSVPRVAASILGYTGPVVVMGGGYDACEDQNSSSPSCAGENGSKVYVIDADTGALIKSFSTDYLGTGTGRSVVADVALIGIADLNVIDHAYVVDTGGNIFRIDFSASGSSSWVMNRVAYTNGSGRKFLFSPALLSTSGGNVYVAIGSGDREHPLTTHYPYTTPVTNRFYVFMDSLSNTTTALNLDSVSTSAMINVSSSATCTAPNILPGSTNKGWFFNLNQNGTGEQTVTSAVIAAGMVTFSTNRPVPAASGSCTTALGEARGYWLNLFNGSGAIGVTGNCGGTTSSVFTGGGMPPSPVFATVLIGTNVVPVVIGAVQRAGGANSSIAPQQVMPTISSKRSMVYWKKISSN